jgi:DUF4097 and DUF4098 domain-containing protein YvlB
VYLNRRGVQVEKGARTEMTQRDIGAFTDIALDARDADIELIASDSYGLEISVRENQNPEWSVRDGKLSVTARAESAFVLEIMGNWDFENQNRIRVYYPESAALENVSLKTGSGDIKVSDADIRALTIANAYGGLELKNLRAHDINIAMSSGNVTLASVSADFIDVKNSYGFVSISGLTAGRAEADLSSGDFTISDSETGFLRVKDDYGAVKANNLTARGTRIDVSSGNVTLSGALSGENTIEDSYGKVTFNTTVGEQEYSYDLVSSYGGVRLNGQTRSGKTDSRLSSFKNSAPNTLNIRASSGSIDVYLGG